ncbi:MAG: glutathione S-transferase family protein, partial [Alphaproteobacteria bacterium]
LLEVVHQETSPTVMNPEVFAQNPLGKVPVLLRADAPAIFDSDVICAYLDTVQTGSSLIPQDGEARWEALRLQAVAQGLCDAGIALRWETARRPAELRYAPLRDGYTEKLRTTYDWLEQEINGNGSIHVGHIAVATALSWIAFRDLPDFREGHPRLADWFDAFETRKSMRSTPLSGETHDQLRDLPQERLPG